MKVAKDLDREEPVGVGIKDTRDTNVAKVTMRRGIKDRGGTRWEEEQLEEERQDK